MLESTHFNDARRFESFAPFAQMGVKIVELSEDYRSIRLLLPLTDISRNQGGSMFGGFQASLADPVAAIACGKIFPEYWVWTRKLEVDFRRPGITDLELRFDFPEAIEEQIRADLKKKNRSTPVFDYGLFLGDGSQCTAVKCAVAIRQAGYSSGQGGGGIKSTDGQIVCEV